MHTVGTAMRLKPDCYDEYKRRHDELWPELAKIMDDNGVSMAIYRHGEELFLFGTAASRGD